MDSDKKTRKPAGLAQWREPADGPHGALHDLIGTAIWVFDIDCERVVWANRAALEIWAAGSVDELRARNMARDMSPSVRRRLRQFRADFIERDATFSEVWTLYPQGLPVATRVRFKGVELASGGVGMLCEGQHAAAQTPQSIRSADALLHTRLMISLHEEDGRTLYLNPAAHTVFDGATTSLAERFVRPVDFDVLVDGVRREGEMSVVAEILTCEGVRWHEINARACHDPASGEPSILVSESDVSELKEAEALARGMAHRDPLTGLPNRLALPATSRTLLDRVSSLGMHASVFFIDLDEFKAINDTIGHGYGDQVLVEVARRLTDLCQDHDAVFRIGGDEFLLIATEPDGETGRRDELTRSLSRSLSAPARIRGRVISVTPSIGIAEYPRHGNDIQALMQSADIAMYSAKYAGRNRARIFESGMRDDYERENQLLAALREGVAEHQFEVHYQARHAARTGRIVSVEALARWNHPKLGQVSPAEFIPLCERCGLMNPVGALVLKRAVFQRRAWADTGFDVGISVNVSERQLSDPGFSDDVAEILLASEADGRRLELEVTETLLFGGNRTTSDNLEWLRELGIGIAIDDFGTGYSNLARLTDMPVDCIKIDRRMIANLPRNAEILRMVIGMCKLLEVTIVAEGIETASAASWARENGCHQLQGFYFGRPVPAEEMQRQLAFDAATPGALSEAVSSAPRHGSGVQTPR